ncbi:hypothetical protein ABBQ32_008772 [Trebouxia sp. C0010 RCD-2024]
MLSSLARGIFQAAIGVSSSTRVQPSQQWFNEDEKQQRHFSAAAVCAALECVLSVSQWIVLLLQATHPSLDALSVCMLQLLESSMLGASGPGR